MYVSADVGGVATFLPFLEPRVQSRYFVDTSRNVPVIFCQFLMKLKFSLQIFGKPSDMKFRENRPSGNQIVPYGRTDGQT